MKPVCGCSGGGAGRAEVIHRTGSAVGDPSPRKNLVPKEVLPDRIPCVFKFTYTDRW